MMTMRNLNNTLVQPAGRRETAGAVPVCVCHKHGAGLCERPVRPQLLGQKFTVKLNRANRGV